MKNFQAQLGRKTTIFPYAKNIMMYPGSNFWYNIDESIYIKNMFFFLEKKHSINIYLFVSAFKILCMGNDYLKEMMIILSAAIRISLQE